MTIAEWIPIIISTAVFVVALLQWRLAREKLRLDLYNRRFEIFASVYGFYDTIFHWTGSDEDKAARARFTKAATEARFLFSDKSGVADILEGLSKESLKVTALVDHRQDIRADRELFMKMDRDAQTVLLTTFDTELRKLKVAVKPYLRFDRA